MASIAQTLERIQTHKYSKEQLQLLIAEAQKELQWREQKRLDYMASIGRKTDG